LNVQKLMLMEEVEVRRYFAALSDEEKLNAFIMLVKHSKFYDEEMKALARDCLKDVFVDDGSHLYEGYDLPG
jgi:hypothetical protein